MGNDKKSMTGCARRAAMLDGGISDHVGILHGAAQRCILSLKLY